MLFDNIKDIVYLEENGDSTDLHLINGDKISIRRTLNEYEQFLCSESQDFIRVDTRYIINIDHFVELENGDFYQLNKKIGITISDDAQNKLMERFRKR